MKNILKLVLKQYFVICYILFSGTSQMMAQEMHVTQRQITLLEKVKRPDDLWPRGDGHVVLGEPGSPLNQKGYHEPGGSFSPAPGSFGMAIWILDTEDKIIATSDNIPLDRIEQRYVWKEGNKIPSIVTHTPYYNCTWTYNDMGLWQFELNKTDNSVNKILLVFRSVGPAGGAVNSAVWDNPKLVINRRWIITPGAVPASVVTGEEEKGELRKSQGTNEPVVSAAGWAFAKLGIANSSCNLTIRDTKPCFKSPLTYEKTVPQFQMSLPDKRFEESLKAQISNLMMAYIGRQTGPGEPVNYPLAWERDGAYSLMAMARSGNLQTAKELSIYFAENDFFGGFGAEGDALGSAINALTEVAFLINDPEYYKWVWPHIQRKLGIIDEMMNAQDNIYKNFIGPLVPAYENDLKRKQLICMKLENNLIYGTMDLHFPVLYINAISYRGLIQASRLALKLGKSEISAQCIEKAHKVKAAWMEGFGQEKYDNERNFMVSVWPSWITNKENKLYVGKIEEQRVKLWSNGAPVERPLWTYFTVSEAHQWLFIDRPDRTWETLNYFWKNQCSQGLYSYWEGNGEENSFHGWDNYRGWLNPKYVTPHYWTASEMTLLQIDMLAYIDESKGEYEIVVGQGVPSEWLNEKMSVSNYHTKIGNISWKYDKHTLNVTLTGADKKYKIRAGISFLKDNTKLEVSYK